MKNQVRKIRAQQHVRTMCHIRTMRSVRISTGPGRHAGWPRLRETERIVEEEKRLPAGLRWHERRPVS